MRMCLLAALCLFGSITVFAQEMAKERHWDNSFEKIRIISYNIFNGFDWGKDNEREVRFINWVKEQDPEILAMQELCGFTQESLLNLAQQWGHSYAVILKENGYPVGITSKKPIDVKSKQLEGYGHGLLHVETYGYDILVTHLNPSNTEKRRTEAQAIVQYIKDHNLNKCLFMGDLNSHSPFDADYMESQSTELLLKYGGQTSPNLLDGRFDYSVISHFLSIPMIDVCRNYVNTNARTTFPTPILMSLSRHEEVRRKVGERIDFIFATPLVIKDVVDAFIWNKGEPDYLSDHFPVGIDLCISHKKNNK